MSVSSSEDLGDVPNTAKREHPKVSVMVNCAIDELNERKGSSVRAIKKYIGSKYEVDPEKQAVYIKKYLKTAVAEGSIIQTSGKGANGCFKLQKNGPQSRAKKPSVIKPTEKEATQNSEAQTAVDTTRIVTSTPHPTTKAKKKLYPAVANSIKGKKAGAKAKEADDNATKPKKVTKPKTDKTKTDEVSKPKTTKETKEPKPTKESKEPKPKAAPKEKAESKNKVSKQATKNPEEKKPKAAGKAPKEKETAEPKAPKRTNKKQAKAVNDDVANAS